MTNTELTIQPAAREAAQRPRSGGEGANGSNSMLSGAKGRTKFILGGAIILLVVAWLVYSNIGASSAYYMTVQELVAAGPGNRIVRAAGQVVGQTIQWDPQTMILQFELEDEGGRLPVVYTGLRPDMFRDGAQAVIEGKYRATGIFEATSLLLKCPSKYAEE